MKYGSLISTLSAAAMLAACASPTSRFYTLGGGDARPVSSAPASFYFELAPVDMPQQVAKNQLVVQTSPAQVRVLEEERWASLPGDEVRRALSSDLTQQLGAIDVYGTPHPESVPVYRVKVNVQRFESWPGAQAVIDYRAMPDWDQEVMKLTGGRGVDITVEVGGAGTLPRSLMATRIGGRIAVIGLLTGPGAQIDPMPILRRNLRVQGLYVGNRQMFEAMNRAIAAGGLEPVIDKVFPFAEAKEAYRHLKSQNHFGKIVIAHS